MMRHPFHEVVPVSPSVDLTEAAGDTIVPRRRFLLARRSFLASAAAWAAAAIALLTGGQGEAWAQRSRRRMSAAKGKTSSGGITASDYTTLAVGEEGGDFPGRSPSPSPDEPKYTTLRFGEEGGDGHPTTFIHGEEG